MSAPSERRPCPPAKPPWIPQRRAADHACLPCAFNALRPLSGPNRVRVSTGASGPDACLGSKRNHHAEMKDILVVQVAWTNSSSSGNHWLDVRPPKQRSQQRRCTRYFRHSLADLAPSNYRALSRPMCHGQPSSTLPSPHSWRG